MTTHHDLMAGPPATRLPAGGDGAAARAALADGTPAATVAARHPTDSSAWAVLAEAALPAGSEGDTAAVIASYAYARTGYHRGLDALRRNGWKGFGPVPADHVPNQGFLRALAALGRAAAAIDERDEAERIAAFLDECDPSARATLGLAG